MRPAVFVRYKDDRIPLGPMQIGSPVRWGERAAKRWRGGPEPGRAAAVRIRDIDAPRQGRADEHGIGLAAAAPAPDEDDPASIPRPLRGGVPAKGRREPFDG